jgi:HSP20 family protein
LERYSRKNGQKGNREKKSFACKVIIVIQNKGGYIMYPVERVFSDLARWGLSPIFNRFSDVEKPIHVHWDEKDGNYVVNAELPGIEKDKVSVVYKDDYLTIKADYGKEEEDEKCDCATMRTGTYSFRGYFPGADPAKIDAELKNGLLSITMAKGPVAAGTTVDIKSE